MKQNKTETAWLVRSWWHGKYPHMTQYDEKIDAEAAYDEEKRTYVKVDLIKATYEIVEQSYDE